MSSDKMYYFLKASTEYFLQNLEMRKLRRKEHGAEMVIIYHKLMADSLDYGGHIYFEGTLEEFAEDFSIMNCEEGDIVLQCVLECQKLKLIDVEDGHLCFEKAPDLTSKETESARKKRRQRAMKKALEAAETVEETYPAAEPEIIRGDNVHPKGDNVPECPPKVINTNTTSSINNININNLNFRKEEVKEEKSTPAPEKATIVPIVDFDRIKASFLKYWPEKPCYCTKKRKALMRELVGEFGYDEIDAGMKKARESPFLRGEQSDNGIPWILHFTWLINAENLASVLEGKYDERPPRKLKAAAPRYQSFDQRDYSMGDLESMLVENY